MTVIVEKLEKLRDPSWVIALDEQSMLMLAAMIGHCYFENPKKPGGDLPNIYYNVVDKIPEQLAEYTVVLDSVMPTFPDWREFMLKMDLLLKGEGK